MSALGLGLDIGALGDLILTGVQAQFTAARVALPKRQVLAPGSPNEIAWDCEMLAVTMPTIGLGQSPGVNAGAKRVGSPISAMGLRHAVFAVLLTRCEPSPSGNGTVPPLPAAMREAAMTVWRDAGLLSQGLVNICTDVAGDLPLGSLVQVGEVQSAGPSGGFVGIVGSLIITAGTLV